MIKHEKSATNTQLSIEGANCASCIGKIEATLKSIDGVSSAEMNFADSLAVITGKADVSQLIEAVERAGYKAKVINRDNEDNILAEKERLFQPTTN